MTCNDHDDGSHSIQGKQADINHGDGSQPVQAEQPVHGSNIVEFDFLTLRQHPALTIEKINDSVQMIIDLDFSQPESPLDIGALLQVLMDYAEIIKDVKILIKAPKQHHNVATCNGRLSGVAMVMSVLNIFNLTKVGVIARLDDHYSFKQLDLGIRDFGSQWQVRYPCRQRG